jgi:hypothetical protein
MQKHWIKWKTLRSKNIYGEPIDTEFPYLIDLNYKGALVSLIINMENKMPITFENAVRIASEKYFNSDFGTKRGQSFWFTENFVKYISELGYHIELTGDEFELPYPSQVSN